MKRLSLAALLLAFPFTAGAAELKTDSKILNVIVYRDRAIVTRVAHVELEPGKNEIVFENLPASLAEDSLSADGKTKTPVTLNGVELVRRFRPEEANARVAALTQEVKKLQYELERLETVVQAAQEERQFLDGIRNFSSVQVPQEIQTRSSTAAEWAELSQFLRGAYADNGIRALEAQKAVENKTKEIEAKAAELNQLGAGRSIELKTAVVSVEAAQKTPFDVELRYVVPNAGWHLSYEAKLDTEKKSCALLAYGNVRQSTGEDWNDVSLTLSSAKPSVGGRMPEFGQWHVDFDRPIVFAELADRGRAAKLAPSASAGPSLDARGDNREESETLKAQMAQAEATQDMGAVNYTIASPRTVLSDNRFYRSPVRTDVFSVTLDYEATPKLAPYAFIHSKVNNDKEFPLPGGPMSVFVNDRFTGTSSIPTVGREEAFDVYLGIDEDIRVKRVELTDKRKKTLLGLRTRRDFGWRFDIENYKKEPVRVAVYDQIPVSRSQDIKVELGEESAKPSEIKDLGVLRWDLELKPGEKKSLNFQFFVEYPSDKTVTGI